MRNFFFTVAMSALLHGAYAATVEPIGSPHGTETLEQRNVRMKWWIDARYGMFIHWDMSSVAGTEISWSRGAMRPLDWKGVGRGSDPAGYVEDAHYDNLYKKFNPVKFNAEEWVKLAKDSGMKYIVFTAKHHGGFCMWDTKLTTYSIMHTPFKRDVLKELADACHQGGMRLGIYYSQRDWHHPDYGIGDNRKYLDYMNGQIRELLTNYGQVDILWWDSYGLGDLVNFWKVGETFDLVKQLQPNIVMNNRLAELNAYNQQPKPYIGDHNTPEQHLGAFDNSRPWESCMCVVKTPNGKGGWSYRLDGKVKSFDECLMTLLGCVTGDGNLLLGVGPDSQGIIPADQSNVLKEVGEWLKVNGETIYGTRGGPFRNGKWGGATYKGRKIFLHISQWDGNKLELPPLKGKIVSCSVGFEQKSHGVTITAPDGKQMKLGTMVTLELESPVIDEFVNGNPLDLKSTLDSQGKPKQ